LTKKTKNKKNKKQKKSDRINKWELNILKNTKRKAPVLLSVFFSFFFSHCRENSTNPCSTCSEAYSPEKNYISRRTRYFYFFRENTFPLEGSFQQNMLLEKVCFPGEACRSVYRGFQLSLGNKRKKSKDRFVGFVSFLVIFLFWSALNQRGKLTREQEYTYA